MIAKIKQLWSNWRAERARQLEQYEKLENLTDPAYLDRATRSATP